jgi:hypothetical protein
MAFNAASRALTTVFRFGLLTVVVVSPSIRGCAQTAPSAASIGPRIKVILTEVKRIDTANDAPDESQQSHRSVNSSHWQFTGFFDHEHPLLLNASFSEGSVVRQETYYLVDDKPVLVKVLRWWDVDDESKAPKPPVRQAFYIDNGQTLRRVIKVESARKNHQVVDTPQPASGFTERANLITKILRTNSRDPKSTEPLESFPEAELPEK